MCVSLFKFEEMRSYGKEKNERCVHASFMAFCFFFTIIVLSFINLHSHRIASEIPTQRSLNEESEDGSVSNNIPFQVLSWSPRVFYLPNFATKQQCESIIEMAKPKLKPSTLAVRKGETVRTTSNVRTSTGVFIHADEDESGLLATIEEKIALATRIPSPYYESFNILRYKLGQKYDAHFDAFHPDYYGNRKSQRVMSFLLYLSSVEEGGETIFPFENYRNMNGSYDYEACIGLKVKPKQGDAIFFYNLFPNKTIDQTSLHGSCPVIKGEKWVATKWITDQMYAE